MVKLMVGYVEDGDTVIQKKISVLTLTSPQGGQRSGSAGSAGVQLYLRTHGGCLLTGGFWLQLNDQFSLHLPARRFIDVIVKFWSGFSSVWIRLFTSGEDVRKCTNGQLHYIIFSHYVIPFLTFQQIIHKSVLNLIIARLSMIKKKKHFPKENVCCESRASVCLCVSFSALGQLLSHGINEVCGWVFCVFVREWTGRASGGDREEEQGDVGKWFSRWDLICETMHPKETFSHGPTPWIQIYPTTRSALEGRMHLASTRSGEVQLFPFFFFFYLNVYFHPITKLNWGDFTAAVMSHPFIPLVTETACSYSVSWGLVFIMKERLSASMLAET